MDDALIQASQVGDIDALYKLIWEDDDILRRIDEKIGRGALTPLHYAIKHENIYLMVNFLAACPESIGDVTVRGETVLHIAVKTNMLEALEVLVGWLQRICHKDALDWVAFIPNWKDEQGNTALDIAVSNMQIQACHSVVS
ncbi:Uncharacterized protein TCM_031618 [Theobroma cacao]|uniref:Uncharacterized protein n=1 Tax=Theobroma cacao TaxID=3641 RepID=A0A061F7T7_THECC|nr:Uncharacterized protein TCM_031618 [Theobroma cacao]